MAVRRQRGALAVWCAAMVIYIVAIAGRTSFGVAGLEAAERFHINAGTLSLFTVVQVGTYAIAQIPVGVLLDRYGSRKIMVAGAIFMAIGQISLAFASSLPVALAVRALIGLGDATAFTAVLRLIPAWFVPRRVPVMTQMTGIVGSFGQVISSLPFAWILTTYGWTPAFLGIAFLGFIAAGIGAVFVRNTPESDQLERDVKNPDIAEAHHAQGNDSSSVRSLTQTLRKPAAWLGFWTHWTTNFPQTTFVLLWGVPFLHIHNGMQKSHASAVLLICTVAGIAIGPLVGRFVGDYPERRSWVVVGSVLATCSTFALVLLWPAPAPMWTIVLLLIALALTGAGSNVSFDFARTGVHRDRLGTANGLINMGGFLASLLAAAMVGLTLDISSGSASLQPGDFKIAMATPIVLLVLGLANFLILHGITTKMARSNDVGDVSSDNDR